MLSFFIENYFAGESQKHSWVLITLRIMSFCECIMLCRTLKVDTECCTLLSFIPVFRCSFQTLEWFYIFCVLGSVYLLCPLNPRMLAFILFTHQYYISTKALRVAFKSLCRVVLKCTPYCEGSSSGNSWALDSHYPA